MAGAFSGERLGEPRSICEAIGKPSCNLEETVRQSHLILSNAAIMWAMQILQLAPQLILVPYLIGSLGESGYGIYALVWPLMTSIEQLQTSLQQGVVKYSAGFLSQGRVDDVNKVVGSSLVYSLLLGAVASAGVLTAAAAYRDPSGQIGPALAIIGVMLLFVFPLTPYVAVIQSKQCFYIGALADTVAKYGGLFLVMAWFHGFQPSVRASIAIMAGMLLCSRLVQLPMAYRLVPGLRSRFSLFDWKMFRLIAFFGAATVFASACVVMNFTGSRWVMNALVSPRFVAHLSIILMPVLLLWQTIAAVTTIVMPATSAYEASGNTHMLRELLICGMRYVMIVTLAGLFAASLLMQDILSIWVGKEYRFLAPYSIALLASAAFMLSTFTCQHMLKGLGKLRTVAIIYLWGFVLAPFSLLIALSLAGVDPYIAVTAGLAAGHITYGLLQVNAGAKAVRVNAREIWRRAYGQPLAIAAGVAAATFGVAVVGSSIRALNGEAGRMLLAFASVSAFLYGCYWLIATPRERQQFHGAMRLLLAKFRAVLGKRTTIGTP